MARDTKFMSTARRRFSDAKTAWRERRKQFDCDARAVNVLGGQWPKGVKEARDDEDRPAMEFNQLHTYVQQIVNRARKERPQIKIGPGDGGDQATADAIEGKIRHIQYASQADVAYDNAVEGAATGGYGYFRINREYVSDDPRAGEAAFHQEPRLDRILDAQTVYFGPADKADYSDAEYCFVQRRGSKEDFKTEFGVEPLTQDMFADHPKDWVEGDDVYWAEYWHVEKTKDELVQLGDGSVMLLSELPEERDKEIVNRRPVTERTVIKDVIDGMRELDHEEWPGAWIPVIPVLGRQVVVEGKMHLIGAVRFAVDPQQLMNVALSGECEMLGTANDSPYIGWKGQFKSQAWRDGKRVRYLEVDPPTAPNIPPQLPQRNPVEPPIPALTSFVMQMIDSIKRGVGYVDNVLRPSQADISGVAVMRREDQADLTNFHIQDNLVRSQWHAGRVILDLLLNLTDTPRAWQVMKQDGTVNTVPVHMATEDGEVPPPVRGFEGQPHHRIDIGTYNVVVTSGPAYATKMEEERDVLLQAFQANPALWQVAGDLLFKLMGYTELEERLKMALPPAIQQAIKGGQNGIPPQLQAKLAQDAQVIQQLRAGLQQVIQKLQMKQVEADGRLKLEHVKAVKEVMLEGMRQDHDADKLMAGHRMEAIEMLMNLLHESELAPDPNQMAAQGGQPSQPGMVQ